MTKLVIVESPAKAKTIQKYLPKDYVVLASLGHVRDLPKKASQVPKQYKDFSWANLGVDVTKGFEAIYVVQDKRSKQAVDEIKRALKDADELLLATDEDREGEAISWHLTELLSPKVPIKRMVFHEITKTAIEEALSQTRTVDMSLVEAQETRRILDRLVGYPLSSLVRKLIKYDLSAGRVQSAAVRLLVERERERRRFKTAQYWDLKAELEQKGQRFNATLHAVDDKRVATGKDFDESTGKLFESKANEIVLLDEAQAKALVTGLKGAKLKVMDVTSTPYTTSPKPPFTTSTLQQEASRKLGFSAKQTMAVAQHLYESGYITYMRTDSVNLSTQAVEAARKAAQGLYGAEFVPKSPRVYTSKAKNAQEAHEAIRPSGDAFVKPEDSGLNGQDFRLYELIWKRTVACQMADAKKTRVRVDLDALVGEQTCHFRAHGNRIDFPGFIRAYFEGADDPEAALEDTETILPPMNKADEVPCKQVDALSHETRPPARFTEASLVRALEELGIGRPSTYATIMDKITSGERYARRESRTLVPTYSAFAVIELLEAYFPELVDMRFTARMEDDLDEIAAGKGTKADYLHKFYRADGAFNDKIERYEKELDPRQARSISLEDFPATLLISKYGPYVQFEQGEEVKKISVPETIPPAELSMEHVLSELERFEAGPQVIGLEPESGKEIYLMDGPYGAYLQLGQVEEVEQEVKKGKTTTKKTKTIKPKRVSLPKGVNKEDVDMPMALRLISLPLTLGKHPETGKSVQAGLGRFGPYLKHDDDFRSVKNLDQLFEITLEEALIVFSKPKAGRGSKSALKEFAHPKSGDTIQVLDGRYGPYLKYKRTNASLPKDESVDDLTVERALEILAEKNGADDVEEAKPKKKAAAKKTTTAKKASTKKKADAEDAEAAEPATKTAKATTAKKTTKAATTTKAAKTTKATKATTAKADDAAEAKKPATKKATTTKKSAK